MLKIDKVTSIHSRGKFTTICVEIDLSKPLLSHIMVRDHKLSIEYEGLHQICNKCGRYEHKAEQCNGFDYSDIGPQEKVQEKVLALQPEASGNSAQGEVLSGQEEAVVGEKACQQGPTNGSESANSSLDKREHGKNEDVGYRPWMVPKKPIRKKPQ